MSETDKEFHWLFVDLNEYFDDLKWWNCNLDAAKVPDCHSREK